jgi:hypothetical protein
MLMLKTTTWLLCNLLYHNLLSHTDKMLLVQSVGVPALMRVEDETIVEDGLLIYTMAAHLMTVDVPRYILANLKH